MKRKTLKKYASILIAFIMIVLFLNETYVHSSYVDKLLDYVVSPVLIGVIFSMIDGLSTGNKD
ncbi:hypothetical protein I6N95_16745 [Vagococcus sp. BWB3-3]|uniref:Uncharacterized protein n=1 Tax=Vagococcus allomyrinae TaxID=2794353 RepID=A0A940P777_9ENTE|nr:hypothetical protein [Vagococcus allomyrinae]MBP1042667.1 hypothetical protein [Vagococcus allomyrinae]